MTSLIDSISFCGRRWVVACFVMLAMAGSAFAQQPVRRMPKPSAQAMDVASAKVQEIFGGDIKSATSGQAKTELAQRLLEFAAEASDATTRFVLLESALRLAVQACDVPLVMDICRRVAEWYDVSLMDLEIEALEKMASSGPASNLGAVIDELLAKSHEAVADDAGLAERLAQLGAVAARKAKDRERGSSATQALAEAREAKKREEKTKPLVDQLRISPSDADAAYRLGVIRCFDELDWDQGLPLLARGSDPALARIAGQDLASREDETLHAKVGDAWWDYGKSQKNETASAALERARLHYTAILGTVKGLERARIEKRLESLENDLKAAGGSPRKSGPGGLAGLVLWLDSSSPKAIQVIGPGGPRPGASVMTVRDASGNGCDAVAPSPQAAPKVSRFGTSRLNSLDFDGVQSALVVRKPLTAKSFSGMTAVVVVDFPGPDVVKDRTYPALMNNQQDATGGFSIHLRGEQKQKPVEFGTWPLRDPTGYAVLSDSAKALVGPVICVATNTNKEDVLYISGQNASRKENTGVVRVRDTLGIGASLDPASATLQRHFQGRIGEVMLYSRALSEAEMAPLVRSLQAKWAVP